MTRPEDAALAAALEYQSRELFVLASRAESVLGRLVAPPPTWQGSARRAYEAGMQGVGASLDAALGSVRAARDETRSALAEVTARA